MSDTEDSPAQEDVPEGFSKEEKQLAMKAFRKRLKLMRLDEESRLGYGPMSSGGKSTIVGIRPPDQFPKELWHALADAGKIKREGGGLYSLVDN